MSVEITSRGKATLVNPAVPDRAATLQPRRRAMADPVLLFFRRNLDSALAEAKKTRDGVPTDLALTTLHWIQVDNRNLDMAVEQDRLTHFRSFAGACEMLGVDLKRERQRMLAEIKASYADAAARQIQSYVRGRMAAVLTCTGLPSLLDGQYQLALVGAEEYEELAGVERPDPPSRPRQRKGRRR